MTQEERLKKLEVPSGPVDVVLDTDTYNEIDDQFALSYMLRSSEKLRIKGIFAAPFFNDNSSSPEDGMEKSYEEIKKLLKLAGEEKKLPLVFRGSKTYLKNEKEPVDSPAAHELVRLGMARDPQQPLYVVAIGAITNVASALLLEPALKEHIVVVWLGGHAQFWPNTMEFNMFQDEAAARIIFGCGVPLVQLPCGGVVENFAFSGPELTYWLKGKNALCDYLVEHTVQAAESYAKNKVWSRVIWDVTAVGWLLNDGGRFMQSSLIPAPIPEYDHHYSYDFTRHTMRYIWHINRDALGQDLFTKLAGK